jgi:hypothetical protein
MKTYCHLCSREWVRIFFCVAGATFAAITISAAIINLFSVGFFISLSATVTLFALERRQKRHSEKICAEEGCGDSCHTIKLCSGRCHHWCEEGDDIDLISGENPEDEKGESFCQECGFTHELFGAKSVRGCPCPCHYKKKKRKRYDFQCFCHHWCIGKKKI